MGRGESKRRRQQEGQQGKEQDKRKNESKRWHESHKMRGRELETELSKMGLPPRLLSPGGMTNDSGSGSGDLDLGSAYSQRLSFQGTVGWAGPSDWWVGQETMESGVHPLVVSTAG